MKHAPHRVVIVGGGFGGIYAARGLRRASVEVTLIDRRNFNVTAERERAPAVPVVVGPPGLAVWLGVHLHYLSGFQNRILVSIRWAWSLFTGSRGSRRIMRPHTAIGSLPLLGDLGGAGWPVENVEADRRSSA